MMMQGNSYEMDVTVITLLDGLKHNYFNALNWNKDSFSPLGTAEFSIPLDSNMLKYWTGYYDIVIISAKLKNNKQNTNSKDYYQKIISEHSKNRSINAQTKYSKKQKEQIMKIFKQRIQNDEYNFSFIARTSQVHKKGANIVVKFEDVGWKFMQKMPTQFRQQYIAGQPVDDAFQAMCEFIGVEFAYSLNTLNEYTFANDGFSITKDNTTIEEVPNLIEDIVDDTAMDIQDDTLAELDKKLQQGKQQKNQQGNDTSLASSSVNSESQNNNSNKTKDVNKKKEEYGVDFESRIKDLFIGNTYYESDLTNIGFHYDAITIQPSNNTQSNQMQNVNSEESGGESGNNDPNNPQSDNN